MGNTETENGDEVGVNSNAAVERGVRWLETTGRGDWWERVDWDRFDFYDGDRCILGQLIGNVFQRPEILRMKMTMVFDMARICGFVADPTNHSGYGVTSAGFLEEAWRREATARHYAALDGGRS